MGTELQDRFPRVALAHDWLTIPGGSEKVVLELLELFPQAEIFTSVYDPGPWPAAITSRPVHTSYLQRLPGATRIYKQMVPLMSRAFEAFDLTGFDLVISSSHANAKNVIPLPGAPDVCYCHTPMRYAWDPSFLEGEGVGRLGRLALRPVLGRMRRNDLAGAARPDAYAANSTNVAARIAEHYGRESRVIHPPVEVERFLERERRPGDAYLVAGRIVPYKRVDLAVRACAKLGRRLRVVGTGRAEKAARAAAGPETEFLGFVADAELDRELASARALLFPGEEDFGIVPVEAQAAGVPVIAYGKGGALDTVRPGETGVLFEAQTVDSLCEAMLEFERLTLDPASARANAGGFGAERFRREFAELVTQTADQVGARAAA